MTLPSHLRLAAQLLRAARRHPRYTAHLVHKKLGFGQRYRWALRHPERDRRVPLPLAFRLMLTWRCDLACPVCMLHGAEGWQRGARQNGGDLPWPVIERILAATRGRPASFILSGGEPLRYAEFPRLLRRLRQERRFCTVCTNGLQLHRHLAWSAGNPYCTYLVSVDGPQREHDALRGPGSHAQVVENIARLKRLPGAPYVGVQLTLQRANVGVIFEFCRQMVALGVDWILLNPQWFLSPAQAADYARWLGQRFGVRPVSQAGYLQSPGIDPLELTRQLQRVRDHRWPIQVSCYLQRPAWVRPFLEQPARCLANTFCYKQWLRMDVLPDGQVAACGQFPDLIVGDLRGQGLGQVWNSPRYGALRGALRQGPLPVCAKCDALYLYDHGRRTL